MKITRKFIRESNLYTEVSNYLYNIFASPQNILSDEVILDDQKFITRNPDIAN